MILWCTGRGSGRGSLRAFERRRVVDDSSVRISFCEGDKLQAFLAFSGGSAVAPPVGPVSRPCEGADAGNTGSSGALATSHDATGAARASEPNI